MMTLQSSERLIHCCATAAIFVFSLAPAVLAQGTLADYQRAEELQTKARHLVVNAPGPMNWIAESDRFWYWRSVKGGTEFVVADAVAGTKKLAFDHDKLAAVSPSLLTTNTLVWRYRLRRRLLAPE